MKHLFALTLTLFILLLGATCEDVVQPVLLCVFPDTQGLAPGVFVAQTQDCAGRSPDFAVHLGDVAPNLSSPLWGEVDVGLHASGVPFTVALGNHDYNHLWKHANLFLSHFDHSSYPGITDVSGPVGTPLVNLGANLNYYALVPTVTGHTYLLITILWFSDDPGVVAWVNDVLEQYPNAPAILTLHDNLSMMSATVAPITFPADIENCGPNGKHLWENIVVSHPNVFLVINGHAGVVYDEPDCATVRQNSAALPVVEMLVNYQHRPPEEGCYRLVTVNENFDNVSARTYCVGPQSYEADANSEYTVTGVNIATRRNLE